MHQRQALPLIQTWRKQGYIRGRRSGYCCTRRLRRPVHSVTKILERLEKVIAEFVPSWSLAPIVRALQALRGVDLIAAVTFATEIGDVGRFESPRQLMGYLGLVPGERSTGETTKRIGITKAGNGRVRTLLVESAWTYRYPPRIGKRKLYRLEHVSTPIRDIAWKAQTRLTARYRMLSARGKKSTVVCTAVARELAGFM
ncbi:transposase [Rhizobium mongolense]